MIQMALNCKKKGGKWFKMVKNVWNITNHWKIIENGEKMENMSDIAKITKSMILVKVKDNRGFHPMVSPFMDACCYFDIDHQPE